MELRRYFSPLLKWWWLLGISFVLAGASSYYVASQQPPIYRTSATLLIGRAFEDPNPTGSELYLSQELARTYADIAGRRLVRDQTMATLGLDQLPEYIARPVPNSQLLEIVVTDTNPQLAQAVANELANQLILQSPTAPGHEEQDRLAFINEQLSTLQVKIADTEADISEKEDALENAFSARDIADLEGEIAGLQSKLTTLQANYAGLLSSSGQGAINTLSLIEPATLPEQPSGPDRLRSVAVTSAIALVLAAGTAYLLEYLDDTLRTVEDLQLLGDVEVLPSIPKFQTRSNPDPLITRQEPRSPAANSFRALRTAILSADGAVAPKVLLISSTAPNDGKSLVAANLSIVMAQGGHKVLLIDADLRRPVQHNLFEMEKSPGLYEVLMGGEGSKFGMQDATRRVDKLPLSILTSGAHSDESPRLLSSRGMKQLLNTMSAKYDYVVIDSPPFLAVSDSLVLSAEVGGTILVVRTGKTRRKELKQVVDQLRAVDANIIGFVLNRLKRPNTGYYRYYDYSQQPKNLRATNSGDGQGPEQGTPESAYFSRFLDRITKSDSV
ncbi:MAG: polysaccharide biosynthesis tyrosine autokinase [bacterium]